MICVPKINHCRSSISQKEQSDEWKPNRNFHNLRIIYVCCLRNPENKLNFAKKEINLFEFHLWHISMEMLGGYQNWLRKGHFLRVFLSKLEKMLHKNNETRSTGLLLQITFLWVFSCEFFSPNNQISKASYWPSAERTVQWEEMLLIPSSLSFHTYKIVRERTDLVRVSHLSFTSLLL